MRKILAIDDDLYILEMYKGIFCPPDFELRTAEDATSGMTVFQEFKPDLLFLDADMPAGGGEKVFDRIRNLFMLNTHVIFYTGSPESVEKFKNKPNVHVLKKPTANNVLLELVNSLLPG